MTDPAVESGLLYDAVGDVSFDIDEDDTFETSEWDLIYPVNFAVIFYKDYGGKAVVRVDVKLDGAVVFQYNLGIPIDVDDDGISDKWEREQVASWNTQFGESQTEDFQFFAAEDDKEKQDPDAAGNTDGGTNMPNHKTEGDSLTVLQEYRGFILDGGAGHGGGHKRLSPSKKGLLVEVDIMAGVTNMPSEAGIRGIMGTVSSGFGNLTTGAGVDLYYVIDETAATHEVFLTEASSDTWLDAHRHHTGGNTNMLDEFVYVVFADTESFFFPDTPGGYADDHGAAIMVDRKYADASAENDTTHFNDWLARTVAHEVTHLIGGDDETFPLYSPYVMAALDHPYNSRTIEFSNITRGKLSLKNKQSGG